MKYIAKGLATNDGKSFDVYLDWSDEGGGWYQWRESKAWAKLFDSEKEALDIAKRGHGPWFNKPKLSSIVIEKIDTHPEITALESHNRDLLAANQVMREALQLVADTVKQNGWDIRNVMEKVNEALSIQTKSNTE